MYKYDLLRVWLKTEMHFSSLPTLYVTWWVIEWMNEWMFDWLIKFVSVSQVSMAILFWTDLLNQASPYKFALPSQHSVSRCSNLLCDIDIDDFLCLGVHLLQIPLKRFYRYSDVMSDLCLQFLKWNQVD